MAYTLEKSLTHSKLSQGLVAFLLAAVAPGAGHYWLRLQSHAAAIFLALVLGTGLFCWSGWVFQQESIDWLLRYWAIIYGYNVFSAAFYAVKLIKQDKEKVNIVVALPLLLTMYLSIIHFKEYVYGMQIFYIPSQSMSPMLNTGDLVMVDVSPSAIRKSRNGDILVFNRPDKAEYYIKRIVAKPGDKLQLYSGQVIVNDQVVASNVKLPRESVSTMGEFSYFMMGDNHQKSYDSRHFGLIEQSKVIGVYQYTLTSLN